EPYQLPTKSVSSPYQIRLYMYGDGTGLVGTGRFFVLTAMLVFHRKKFRFLHSLGIKMYICEN
ncbi:hypothetical protein L0N23_25455, partial [Bacteroides intestinalis]|uniref:hypothetical protein n=1 Tax=Bacteroides intestinalis TaxID=329854 RepID=UPI001EDBEE72